MNMLEFAIADPVPSETHEYEIGATIWKYMFPDPWLADEDGMATLKQTLFEFPGQYVIASPWTMLANQRAATDKDALVVFMFVVELPPLWEYCGWCRYSW
jgi:hypothetical protein